MYHKTDSEDPMEEWATERSKTGEKQPSSFAINFFENIGSEPELDEFICCWLFVVFVQNEPVPAQREWSDYRKYLPVKLKRIRLKMEKNCRLFLDIFAVR